MKFMYKQLLTVAALLSINNAINAITINKEFGFYNTTKNDIVLRITERTNKNYYQIIPSNTKVTHVVSDESACLMMLESATYNPAAGGSDLVDKSTLRIPAENQRKFGNTVAVKYAFMPVELKLRNICKSSDFIIYDSGREFRKQPLLVAEIDQVARAN
jgi:hypothetical protein